MSNLWKTATSWDEDEFSEPSAKDWYYHVSPHRFEPGHVLTPGSERGVRNFPVGGNGHVYMSVNQPDAEDWAGHIGRTLGADKMHVYRVEPQGETRKSHGDFGWEHTAPRAVVREHLFSLYPEDWEEDW